MMRSSHMRKRIRKAVFPVAGLGTRMFPASKSIPKEMLTLVDRPIVEWVFEEAKEAGIEQFIFVTSRNKSSIEDHFDSHFELEQALSRKGSLSMLEGIHKRLPEPGAMMFVRQQRPLGLGHAIWCARHAVGDEPFAVLLPDMVMRSSPGCLTQMIAAYDLHGGNVLAAKTVPRDQVNKYGILDVQGSTSRLAMIHGMVEKPSPEAAPSKLAIIGRYILQPEIFDVLSKQRTGAGGEVQLTDGLLKLLNEQSLWALNYDGDTFDCGDKFGLLYANVAMGLEHAELGEPLRDAIQRLMTKSDLDGEYTPRPASVAV